MIETGFRLACTINGIEVKRTVGPMTRVLDLLRSDLGLTGTKPGCEAGRCGACMVLVDGEPMNACLLMAYQIDGKSIVTSEGVAEEELHPIQTALLEEGGLQCGYCTPGMVVSLKGLFDREAAPTREEILEALSGNLCRCTGYEGILRAAVRLATGCKVE
ncbi:(2Fe-2S)-binding protein [Gorillibacterium sp. sgz5001074]|uniref:(2Fe-2S)-binding protein n=1 Tax=Gorillibacterium sp. sgz5001074 TaxID=3446695 RepID=UPI003F67E0A1